ncbi:DUF2271 domain-containing protein [Marinimicrobium alkaliphilum]|uniref:DUF2271 domain-containing protein n=1 Tax=Marinimicrobium alkaliphilum TaxID=2202654 RepID=UPI0018E08FF8|nr:DUF2271 domain-containing protein [Marinimicrobium alkaliphilum]
MNTVRKLAAVCILLFVTMGTHATEMTITLDIPRLQVAEYHRPYVAVWIARENHQVVRDLAVWYDLELRNNEGEKWLKDMRQWWRRSGRSQTMPIDGVTGATRAPGTHQLTFVSGEPPLGDLAEGDYVLWVEAAREVGGRELLSIPFTWPASGDYADSGSEELGNIRLVINAD